MPYEKHLCDQESSDKKAKYKDNSDHQQDSPENLTSGGRGGVRQRSAAVAASVAVANAAADSEDEYESAAAVAGGAIDMAKPNNLTVSRKPIDGAAAGNDVKNNPLLSPVSTIIATYLF